MEAVKAQGDSGQQYISIYVEVWFIRFIRRQVENNEIKNTSKIIIYINVQINAGVAPLSILQKKQMLQLRENSVDCPKAVISNSKILLAVLEIIKHCIKIN